MFDKCKQVDIAFVLGKTLLGVVTDWSDSEIKGLKNVVGEETAGELLKGCQVHWLRSCKRVAEHIASSTNKHMEYGIFIKFATKIQVLKSAINTVACFESLCGVRTVTQLIEQIPDICCLEVASYIDENCNWSKAKN